MWSSIGFRIWSVQHIIGKLSPHLLRLCIRRVSWRICLASVDSSKSVHWNIFQSFPSKECLNHLVMVTVAHFVDGYLRTYFVQFWSTMHWHWKPGNLLQSPAQSMERTRSRPSPAPPPRAGRCWSWKAKPSSPVDVSSNTVFSGLYQWLSSNRVNHGDSTSVYSRLTPGLCNTKHHFRELYNSSTFKITDDICSLQVWKTVAVLWKQNKQSLFN